MANDTEEPAASTEDQHVVGLDHGTVLHRLRALRDEARA